MRSGALAHRRRPEPVMETRMVGTPIPRIKMTKGVVLGAVVPKGTLPLCSKKAFGFGAGGDGGLGAEAGDGKGCGGLGKGDGFG